MSDDHSNREHDGRFPSNVDQRYITWPEYERFHNGSDSGPTSTSGYEDTSPEPTSPEELQSRMQAAAELDIHDKVEQTRRNIIYHLQVEEGQNWPDSFAIMIRMEKNYIQRMRNKNASPFEIATANYMLQNPVPDDWASRQGNRWCMNLKRAVEKKTRTRKKNKVEYGTTNPQTSTDPHSQPNRPGLELVRAMFIGFAVLVILAMVVWYAIRRVF